MSAAAAFLALASLWAALALAAQAVRSAARVRQPFAARAGDPGQAVLYNFTVAMLPSHKESARLHPASFVAGSLLHIAILDSLAAVYASLLPASFEAARPVIAGIAALGVAAWAFLLGRRLADRELRTISVPDDFVAGGAVGLLLVSTLAASLGGLPVAALQIVAGLLLIYLPLGKLRHALFFFLARAELGRRLGWRGVYPPARIEPHG